MLIQTVGSGLGFYNMAVYINRLSAELAVPVSDISFAVSLFFVIGGVAGLYVAALLARFNARTIMIAGALLAGTALGLVGWATKVWQVYVLFSSLVWGMPVFHLWLRPCLLPSGFPGAERSMALALTSTGLSLGGVVLTPLSAYWLNTIGVSDTMPLLGAFARFPRGATVFPWCASPQATRLALAPGRWTTTPHC